MKNNEPILGRKN